MNIIVHYPTNDEDMAILQTRVAQVHAQAVMSYLSELDCSVEQKTTIIDSMIHTLKSQSE